MTSTPISSVEHWTFQVDNPLRAPAEIQELASSSPSAVETEASPRSDPEDVFFGEDLSRAEEEFEAYEADESDGEAEAYEGSEFAESELLEETPASEHPLASVFTLPRLAFDAMAKGGWPLAIATAVGAGLRDVNQLTNMIFWFRHPQMIGQRIGSDQHNLAREWLQIRDEMIKPILDGRSPTAPVPSLAAVGPASSASTTTGGRTSIPSDGLRWQGPAAEDTPELIAFMRRVYDLHVQRSQGNFVDTLPASAIEKVESSKYARKDAAAKAREMLSAARAALAADGLSSTVRIGVLSAYRSADQQFDIWQGKATKGRGGFPHYYAKTKATRRLSKYGGEHSDKAAAYLAEYMGRYVAAPGYSNHQDGLALDLGTRKGEGGLVKLYTGAWFHTWLTTDAGRFQFKPLASEAWHWVYRPSSGGAAFEAIESEVTPTAVRAGSLQVVRIPLLARHRGEGPDLILRWNDIPTVPTDIDVVVHLHGYSLASMSLPKQIETWAGLDLAPVDGATGTGPTRPTLTVLPRGHFTGVKVGRIYKYTFPALTTKGGLTSLVRIAVERFSDRVGGSPPKVGRLILTAHSGGGAPLMQLLRRHDPHQVFVFDGLYQDATPLAEWARRHIRADRVAVDAGASPTGAMRVFFGPTTRRFSLRLRKELAADLEGVPAAIRDRYRVETSSLGHWQIPRQYGWRMLSDPGADAPSASPFPPKKQSLESQLELDAAEMPFLPEAPFLPETGDAPGVAEAGEDALWEDGGSEYEGDVDLREGGDESEDETDPGLPLEATELEDQELEDPELEDPELEDPELEEENLQSGEPEGFDDERLDEEGSAVFEEDQLGPDDLEGETLSSINKELDEGSDEQVRSGLEDATRLTVNRADAEFAQLVQELERLSADTEGTGGLEEVRFSGFLPFFKGLEPPSPGADISVAVPPFNALQRLLISFPLLDAAQNASAIRWNARHPTISGVDPDHIRTDLARYVNASAVRLAILAFNQKNPSASITLGTPPVDAVFVESVHQFQAKCFFEKKQIDGLAGESTLDSLGLLKRRGMNAAAKANTGAVKRLRKTLQTGDGFTADNWFDSMVNPTFLGWRFTSGGAVRGVHLTFMRKLRLAEQALLAQSRYQGKTPVELGRALDFSASSEEHKGARPTASTASMHTYGLAVDIRYSRNPWVKGAEFTTALKHAALLISGEVITQATSAAFLQSIPAGRTTEEVYEVVAHRDRDFRTYLVLDNDVAELERLLQQRRADGTPGVFDPSTESVEQAARRWQPMIRRDRDNMRSASSPFRDADKHLRDPLQGFLNLHKDLVVALRDKACLAWGAVDIGPNDGGNGDMMHFDARVCGLGDRLAHAGRNFAVTANHPCTPCAAPPGQV